MPNYHFDFLNYCIELFFLKFEFKIRFILKTTLRRLSRIFNVLLYVPDVADEIPFPSSHSSKQFLMQLETVHFR